MASNKKPQPKDDWQDLPVKDDWEDIPVNASQERAQKSSSYLNDIGSTAAQLVPLAQFGASFIPAARLPMAAIQGGLGAYQGFYDDPEAELQQRLLQAGKKGLAEAAFSAINIPGMNTPGLRGALKRMVGSGLVAGAQDVAGQAIAGKEFEPSNTASAAGAGALLSGGMSYLAPKAQQLYQTYKRFGKGINLSKLTESELDDLALAAMNKADKSLQDKLITERSARRAMQEGRSVELNPSGLNQFLEPVDQAKVSGWNQVKEKVGNFYGPAGAPQATGVNPQTGVPYTMMDIPNPGIRAIREPGKTMDRFVGSQPVSQELDFQAFPKGAEVPVKPLETAFPASQMDVGQGPYILHGRFPAEPMPAQVWKEGKVTIPGEVKFQTLPPQQVPVPHYTERPTGKVVAPLNELEDIKNEMQGMFNWEKTKNVGKESKITSPKQEKEAQNLMGYLTSLQHGAGEDVSSSLGRSSTLHDLQTMLDPIRSTQGSRLTMPSSQYAGTLQKIGNETGDDLYELSKYLDIANSIQGAQPKMGTGYIPMSKSGLAGALMTKSPRLTQFGAGATGTIADVLSRSSPFVLNQLLAPYREENQ